jgi:hypothetical protein
MPAPVNLPDKGVLPKIQPVIGMRLLNHSSTRKRKQLKKLLKLAE